jgi:hypothetical protein
LIPSHPRSLFLYFPYFAVILAQFTQRYLLLETRKARSGAGTRGNSKVLYAAEHLDLPGEERALPHQAKQQKEAEGKWSFESGEVGTLAEQIFVAYLWMVSKALGPDKRVLDLLHDGYFYCGWRITNSRVKSHGHAKKDRVHPPGLLGDLVGFISIARH